LGFHNQKYRVERALPSTADVVDAHALSAFGLRSAGTADFDGLDFFLDRARSLI
jgi:hypothetical protein